MTSELVILSPHLDDAVLSLGGLIAAEVRGGKTVEVISCFTAGPPLESIPAERRVFGDYAMRRDEDERALALLGARYRWLDLHERIWREPPLPRSRSSFPTPVFRTPPHMDDFRELRAIRSVIAELLDAGATRILAPLSVGHHVDHVEVTLATLRELFGRGAFERISFYEDPYALGRVCRMQHFVAKRRMWKPLAAPAWSSPYIGGLLAMVAAATRGPRIDDYLPEAARLDWRCAPRMPELVEEEMKLAAIAQYGSQVRAFGGMDRVRALVRRAHAALGGEPIWSCRPPPHPR